MRGLLYKDFQNMKRLTKQYALIFIVMFVMSLMLEAFYMAGAYLTMVGAMSVLTTFSYDEYGKWDKYALTMPLVRRDLVRSKYVFLLITGLGSIPLAVAAGIPIALISDSSIPEVLASNVSSGLTMMTMFSLILPVIFKLGVEKARIMMSMIFLAVFAVVFLGIKGLKLLSDSGIDVGSVFENPLFWIGAAVLILLIMGGSYLLSLRFMERKEF